MLFQIILLKKSFAFGKSYLEGYWVGVYKNSNGKLRYFWEKYTQDFNQTSIHGECYDESGRNIASWNSSNVFIDTVNSQLNYVYTNRSVEVKSSHLAEGFCQFEILSDGFTKCPNKLKGSSCNKNFTENTSVEIKVNHKAKTIVKKKLKEKNIKRAPLPPDYLYLAKDLYLSEKAYIDFPH